MPATETNAGVPTGSLTSTTLRYVTLAGARRRGCRSVRCGINWRQSRMWRFRAIGRAETNTREIACFCACEPLNINERCSGGLCCGLLPFRIPGNRATRRSNSSNRTFPDSLKATQPTFIRYVLPGPSRTNRAVVESIRVNETAEFNLVQFRCAKSCRCATFRIWNWDELLNLQALQAHHLLITSGLYYGSA